MLTKTAGLDIIIFVGCPIRATKKIVCDIWPLGQVVKTPPFHGDNMGSNPVGVTIEKSVLIIQYAFFSDINS